MWEKVKEWAKWVYEWITVITAVALGILASVDIEPLFGSDKSLKIITTVAILKAVAAYIQSRRDVAVS